MRWIADRPQPGWLLIGQGVFALFVLVVGALRIGEDNSFWGWVLVGLAALAFASNVYQFARNGTLRNPKTRQPAG